MTVLEMQSPSSPIVRWTEVCTTEHGAVARRSVPLRTSSVTPLPVAPGPRRAVRARVGAGAGVRACRVDPGPAAAVVDDVPTWMLLACGIGFGVVLLLLLAFVGGPAYA